MLDDKAVDDEVHAVDDEVDGTDEDMFGKVADDDDSLKDVGLVADTRGLSGGLAVGLENDTTGMVAVAAGVDGVEVEAAVPAEAVVMLRSSASTFLDVIVRRMLWYLLSSCCLCSWSVDCALWV